MTVKRYGSGFTIGTFLGCLTGATKRREVEARIEELEREMHEEKARLRRATADAQYWQSEALRLERVARAHWATKEG